MILIIFIQGIEVIWIEICWSKDWERKDSSYLVREISSFLRMLEEKVMPNIVQWELIDPIVLIVWMMEPNKANELIQVERMKLFHKVFPMFDDHH